MGAYASSAGVRRVLADQGGVLGAAGDLLYQPALQGVAISLAPTRAGARIRIHSALDPALVGVGAGADGTAAFSPSLPSVMPAGASLMLDVTGLDKVAPQVLNAGSAAGLAGGIGPLLSRLGSALKSEGVDVSDLLAIFHRETAVAILGTGQSPTLVVVARAPDQRRTQNELAQLEAPLAQLFSAPGANQSSEPVFNDRQVAGITAHQLQLATGFQLDYAVFRGLVVISTSLQGIEAVAQRSRPLARVPAFRAAIAGSPARVTSLVFASLAQLIGRRSADRAHRRLAGQPAAARSAARHRRRPDLDARGDGRDHAGHGRDQAVAPRPTVARAQTSEPGAAGAPRRTWSARSTVRTIPAGLLTPRKAKSYWDSPAVSNSTVPMRSSRSNRAWLELTFWMRSSRVWWTSRERMPVWIVSR